MIHTRFPNIALLSTVHDLVFGVPSLFIHSFNSFSPFYRQHSASSYNRAVVGITPNYCVKLDVARISYASVCLPVVVNEQIHTPVFLCEGQTFKCTSSCKKCKWDMNYVLRSDCQNMAIADSLVSINGPLCLSSHGRLDAYLSVRSSTSTAKDI